MVSWFSKKIWRRTHLCWSQIFQNEWFFCVICSWGNDHHHHFSTFDFLLFLKLTSISLWFLIITSIFFFFLWLQYQTLWNNLNVSSLIPYTSILKVYSWTYKYLYFVSSYSINNLVIKFCWIFFSDFPILIINLFFYRQSLTSKSISHFKLNSIGISPLNYMLLHLVKPLLCKTCRVL